MAKSTSDPMSLGIAERKPEGYLEYSNKRDKGQ